MTSTNDEREALAKRIAQKIAKEPCGAYSNEVYLGALEGLKHSLPAPAPAAGEAVDRVARAIYLAMHGDKGGRWECVEPRYQEQVWGAYAKAAIAALANHSPDAGDVGEVEAIVAWLRSEADSYAGGALIKGALRGAAERIENGDHRAALRPVPRGEG